MSRLFLGIALLTVSCWFNLLAAETNAQRNSLRVSVVRLQRLDAGKGLSWDLAITNNSARLIRLSQFSLVSMLLAVDLQDNNGKKWEIPRDGWMWDPPPTDVDFSLLIRPGGKVVTNFETLGIKLSEATTINTNRLPRELTYKFKGEVHAMGTDQRFFEYSAAGSGKVQIKERAGQ